MAEDRNYDRDIGALQATVAMLASAMKDQALANEKMMQQQYAQYISLVSDFKTMIEKANKQIEDLKSEVKEMRSMVDQAKGGWKILVGVGTISATFGAIITKLLSPFITIIPR